MNLCQNLTMDQLIEKNQALYAPVFSRISDLLAGKAVVLAAIDGRCGSGKTTMAAAIQRSFPCHVFHMDDYYLPFESREKNWPESIAGNMDLERIRQDILLPARFGQPVLYRPYDCRNSCFRASSAMAPARLNIMEGSYSHHPRLRDLYDLTVFLTLDTNEQERRLRLREGERFGGFASRWIPMEERYFAACAVESRSDYVLHTDRQIPEAGRQDH